MLWETSLEFERLEVGSQAATQRSAAEIGALAHAPTGCCWASRSAAAEQSRRADPARSIHLVDDLPSLIVLSTTISPIAEGSTVSGFSESTTRSASLPTSMDPSATPRGAGRRSRA